MASAVVAPVERTARPRARALDGEKAQRIVEAMRESVAEVGIADSTFERVARKAGVSRGLLHYYFATKERLLVEVIRRDTDLRIERLGASLRAAGCLDELIFAFFDSFRRTLEDEQGYVYMVSELFVAGRDSEELTAEVGKLYSRARADFADVLAEKQSEGIVSPRYSVESVLAYLFAAGDGASVQLLTDPTIDAAGLSTVSYEVARHLLSADAV